ncbi:MAG: TolC family outer membrane protein [Rubricella sp.]
MRPVLRLTAAFLAITLGGGSAASAQTLTEALERAYATSPALELSRAAVRAADEGVPQARAGARPNVTANARAGLASQDGIFGEEPLDSQSLSLNGSVRVFDGGATDASVNAAMAVVTQARADLAGTEQNVLLAAVTAYVDVLRDTQFVRLARNNVRVINSQLEAAQDRFEVGEVTRTDVAQARSRLAAARSNLVANEGALNRSREAYVAAIGDVPTELAPTPPLPALPTTLAEAEAMAMRMAPSLVAARQAVEEAEYGIELARAGFRPTVDVTGSVTSSSSVLDDTSDTAEIGISASVPLYRGGALSSAVRQAVARKEQAEAALQETARSVRRSVADAWSGLEVSRASIQASRERITAARIAFEGVREEARLGARTTLAVLDAEQELLDALTNLAAAERDEYVAAYQLLASVGLLNATHLGLAVDIYDPTRNYDAVQNGPFATGGRGEILDRILGRY